MKTSSGSKPAQSLRDTQIASDDRDVSLVFVEGFVCTHFSKCFFPPEQCCYVIEVYFLNNKSFKETRRLFKEKFGDRYTVPDSAINQIVRHFQNRTHHDVQEGEWEPLIITSEKKEEIMSVVSANHCVSVSHLAPHVNFSRATTHCVLHSPKLKPYRISIQQELQPAYYTKHILSCE